MTQHHTALAEPVRDGTPATSGSHAPAGRSATYRASLGRGATILASGLLVLAIGAPVAAASPAPSTTPAPAASPAGPAATPALTFAPLVTLPPIFIPDGATPVELADGYSLGAADAPVTMEVWEDFQCPWCAAWTAQVKPLIVEAYIQTGKVRLTYQPMSFLGDESQWAAVAADLAAEQDRFWPLHDLFFANHLGENVGSFSLDRILAMGEAAGLDMAAFRDGLQLEKARERYAALDARIAASGAELGVRGTPSIVINGRLLTETVGDQVQSRVDFESISAAIEAALAEASPAPEASTEASPAP